MTRSNKGRWVLILGGGRSGKSAKAEQLARAQADREVLYVATAEPRDAEMEARVQRHRADRAGYGWRTLEAPTDTAARLRDALAAQPPRAVVLDCLTILVSNVVCGLGEEPAAADAERQAVAAIESLMAVMRESDAHWYIVSNEVGLGLVPATPLGRAFRDALGRVNQRLAAAADEVWFMAAGVGVKLKDRDARESGKGEQS